MNFLVPRDRKYILQMLINGLKRLEYRGYDSAGMAVDSDSPVTNGVDNLRVAIIKKSGKVMLLEKEAEIQPLDMNRVFLQHCGISHTRWATHGPPNEVNCHPHTSDPTGEFTVIHNGIITNYKELKILLEKKGYPFVSETDTECIAKMIKFIFDRSVQAKRKVDFHELVEETIATLEGAFALVFKSSHFPNELVATRRGSPLLIGIRRHDNEHDSDSLKGSITIHHQRNNRERHSSTAEYTNTDEKETLSEWQHADSQTRGKVARSDTPAEFFFASDASAIIEHTKRVIFLEDADIAYVMNGRLEIHHISASETANTFREIKTLDIELQEIMKGSFKHFMLKEIYEQPDSIFNTMRGRVNFDSNTVVLGGMKKYLEVIKRSRRLMFIGCGTSYNSAVATRQFIEEMTELPVIIDIASDFLDRSCPIFRDDVCFFISQSGETADTLNALRYCKTRGALLVGITNTVGSTIARETDCGIHVNAGPEIGVASTKAYTSQILTLVMFGLLMSADSISKQERRKQVIDTLKVLPEKIREVIQLDAQLLQIASVLKTESSLLVMGRGYNFANCLEGALKIKELTYMHSEGILAGELKHGPLALIDSTMPVIMIMMKDLTFPKSQNALEQVVARGGCPFIICSAGDRPSIGNKLMPDRFIEIPTVVDCLQSILTVIPLQILSYHIATLRGLDVDCPRNLAKSVTVE